MIGFLEIDDLFAASNADLTMLSNGVIGIGNFDGVHKGHRVVLDTAQTLAANGRTKRALAMTFEPHPRAVFQPERPVFRLTPRHEKSRLLACIGLSGVVIVPFDADFSKMSAEQFVTGLLVDRLKVSHVVIGYDFHFGKGRRGTPEFLMEMGKTHGFAVSVVPAQRDEAGSLVYSSTAIRAALSNGDIKAANAALGYRYFVSGEIIHGRKEGRKLGYPTANMALAENCQLKYGIYAVEMRVDGYRLGDGVASFGRRPTFDNGLPLLETYLFDFNGELYGKRVEIAFVDYLRPEVRFDDLQALIDQMARDCDNARNSLKNIDNVSAIDHALRTRDY